MYCILGYYTVLCGTACTVMHRTSPHTKVIQVVALDMSVFCDIYIVAKCRGAAMFISSVKSCVICTNVEISPEEVRDDSDVAVLLVRRHVPVRLQPFHRQTEHLHQHLTNKRQRHYIQHRQLCIRHVANTAESYQHGQQSTPEPCHFTSTAAEPHQYRPSRSKAPQRYRSILPMAAEISTAKPLQAFDATPRPPL